MQDPVDPRQSSLRHAARECMHAAKRISDPKLKQKLAARALKLAQRAEALGRRTIVKPVSGAPTTDLAMLTASHLRGLAKSCRETARTAGATGIARELYVIAAEYDGDADRLEHLPPAFSDLSGIGSH